MFGQQNPFGLGRMGTGQQPNQPSNPPPGGPETASPSNSNVQGIFGQGAASRLGGGQPTNDSVATDRPGTFGTFGQSATFSTSSGLSQFGAGSPTSTNAPVFGSNFHSPAMPIASKPNASSPPSYRLSPEKPLQRSRTMPGFGQVPWIPTAPIFPAGASNSPHLAIGKPLASVGASTNNLFGQRFGQNAPTTNIFGNVSKEPAMSKVVEAPHSQYSLIAPHNSTAEPESAITKSLGDQLSQTKPEIAKQERGKAEQPRPGPARRVTVQRKSPLFTRALAGAARQRLPSREERPRDRALSDPRTRKLSERRSSVTDPDSLEKTRVSPQELQQLTSIMCKGMPEEFNNKQTLLRHFGKFGVVTRIYCNVPKNSAYVYFQDHDAAANAKASGTVIEPGTKPMLILWTKSSTSARPKSSTPTTPNTTTESTKPDKLYTDPTELKEELASMVQDHVFEPPKLLQRPKGGSTKRRSKHGPADASDLQQQEAVRLIANTAEERYRELDNRDKLLRQGVKKQSNLATAKATIGTCPDMCPEKERYMREHRNQLHPFEVKPDSDNKSPIADHRKIIKEYSRSSADQEEPLPHELRSAYVLSMTMGYLVCNIMDLHEQGQSSAEEWFDFVWNRTRAIRKDITQQHLCDHAAVALVEKCARFHIHCAARLCEEDMSIFDQKINNENLTNCLQTLKYFYEDMKEKGEHCASEAEFRAYEVLLNLNEGDILRQVQLLAPEVRESHQVMQALGFYAALNTNNYVRFFKLVRSTSYLNACILQRYFTQVRLKALHAIVRAYSPIKQSGQFPVMKLVEILAFEDARDACDFVVHHGLLTDGNFVTLDRVSFSQPENPVPLHRSLKIIESKRRCLVGEVINDGPLPQNPLDYHVPYCSFDGQGSLNKELDEGVKSQEISQQQVDSATESQAQAEALLAANRAEEQRAIELNQVLLAVMDGIINDVVVDAITRCRSDILRHHESERRLTLETCSSIMQAVCPQLMRQIAEQMYAAEKLEELKARKRREEAELARQEHIRQFNAEYSEAVWETVLLATVKAEAHILSTKELYTAKEVARQLSIERSCEQISQEFWENYVVTSLHRICGSIHTELLEFRMKTLSRVSKKLGIWRSAAAFRKWRNHVARRKRTRRSMETFPSCNLRPIAKQTIGDKTMRVLSPLQIVQDRKHLDRILNVSILNCSIRESFSQMWIDIISLAKKHVTFARKLVGAQKRTLPQNLYWSIMFSFPKLSEDVTGRLSSLIDWLNAKFAQPGSHAGSNSSEADVLNMVVNDDSQNFGMPYMTAVCVKGVQGCLPDTDASASLLRGTQALLFVLQIPKRDSTYDRQKYWVDEWQRLTTVLHSMPKIPAIPLMVIAIGKEERPIDLKHVTESLHLDALLASNHISAFSVVTFASNFSEPSSTQVLLHNLQWAAEHYPNPPNLYIERFSEFMNKAVTKFYSSLVYRDLVRNGNAERQHQPPDVLINAYNYAIEHAASTLSDEALMDVSWPQAEFSGHKTDLPKPNWNAPAILHELKKKALFCLLPKFSSDVRTCTDWAGLLRIMWSYVEQLQDAHWGSKMVLASKIEAVFQDSRNRKQEAKVLPYECVAWTEVVEVFIDHSLQMPLGSEDLQIVYDLDKMELFTTSKEWERATLWSSKPMARPQTTSTLPVTKRKSEPVVDSSTKRKLTKDPFQSPSKSEGLQQSYTELKRQLSIEKAKAMEFEAFLARALQEGNISNF